MPRQTQEKFLDSLDGLREKHFVEARGRIKGDLKHKFITDLKQKGDSIDKRTNDIFKYYYDNHPNIMTY